MSFGFLLWAVFTAAVEGQTLIDLRTQTKSVDFSSAGSTKPMRTGNTLPATCAPGELFFLTSGPAGSSVYGCNPANIWTAQGGNLAVNPGTANQVLSSNGTTTQWVPLAGDISGAPGAVTVHSLQGRSVSNTAPSDGQVLKWNAAENDWEPAPGQTGNSSFVFASQTTITIPGSVHQFATANLIVDCYDSSTPARHVEPDTIQINPATYDVTIAFSTAQTGYCVVNGAGNAGGSGGSDGPVTVNGDLAGNTAAATVTGIQNRAVASTAPADGQALVWNAAGSAWKPATIAGGAVTSAFGRTGAVIAQTGDYNFAQISGTVASTQLPPPSGDLSGSFSSPSVTGIQNRAVAGTAPSDGQALVWSAAGSAWKPASITGGVTTVFGRSGAVTAQTGDYSFTQISGSLSSAQMPTGISAANIGSGTVTNTSFGYLANVTSDLQTQLNAKAPLSGDLGGNTTAATVTGVQGRAVSNTAPSDGQALVWSAATSRWQPSNVAGSGGASMAYQLGDLAVTRTSTTVLTIGANCSTSAPCNVRFGYQVYSIANSATATISGSGTGAAYIYITSAGNLIVGHNLTLACSAGCTQQSGITSFPANVIPVYTWTATNGAWDSAGGHDQRAFLSAKTLLGGQGIVVTEAPGQSTLSVDAGVIPTYLSNSATLSFSSIPAGGCSSDLTLNVVGANTGDAVAPGWPAGLPSGLLGIMLVSSSNTVSVRLCNFSGSAVQPPSTTYRATIVRNY
jgi:hypothetical protein